MAVHHSTPPFHPAFSQFLENLVGNEIRQMDSIVAASHLGRCEYEDYFFGCGAQAVVTDLESERNFCLKHFWAINQLEG
jgi:hypothetical protein